MQLQENEEDTTTLGTTDRDFLKFIKMEFKCLTWNINGACALQKRKKLFHYLKKLKLDVVCLQNTYKKEKKLFNKNLREDFIFCLRRLK